MRSELRAPRIQVLADGTALPGVMAADVSTNNHLAADRFRVRLAAGAGALSVVDVPEVRLDVQVSLDGVWSSLVVGEADSVAYDPLRGVIDIEGRDLSALLIDTRVDETFANRTSSEIATTLAERHGLGVSATATSTLVGRYYQSEHDRVTMGTFTRAMSEWDLLSTLAVQEGFDLFMDGAVLRFEPSLANDPVVVSAGRLPEHTAGPCDVDGADHRGDGAELEPAWGAGGRTDGPGRRRGPGVEAQGGYDRTCRRMTRRRLQGVCSRT